MNTAVEKPNTTLTFSDEQAMILEGARDFCGDKSPISAVRGLLDSEAGYDPAVWEELVGLGWLGLAIPESYGGSGLGVGSLVPLAEAMGRSMLSTPFFSSTLAAQALLRGASTQQQEVWLPRIAEGAVGTLALLENEDWGDDVINCTGAVEGDKITLNGTKWYVSDAGVAELFLVSLRVANKPALALVTL